MRAAQPHSPTADADAATVFRAGTQLRAGALAAPAAVAAMQAPTTPTGRAVSEAAKATVSSSGWILPRQRPVKPQVLEAPSPDAKSAAKCWQLAPMKL